MTLSVLYKHMLFEFEPPARCLSQMTDWDMSILIIVTFSLVHNIFKVIHCYYSVTIVR